MKLKIVKRRGKWVVNRMKVKEIRELTTAEMLDQEKQLKEELFNLRFQLATGQLRKHCTC